MFVLPGQPPAWLTWVPVCAQDETLRPFVSVLRLADCPAVRQRAVRAVAAAISDHGSTLGSGAQLGLAIFHHSSHYYELRDG